MNRTCSSIRRVLNSSQYDSYTLTSNVLIRRQVHGGVMDPLRLRPSRYPAELPEKLLTAIRRRKPIKVWEAYEEISKSGKLKKLSAEHHAMALRSFQLKNLKAYGPSEIKFYRGCLMYILETMKEQNYKLDVRDYNFLLDFYGRSNDWDSVVKCWEELTQKVQPNEYSYNLYLYATLHCKKYQETIKIFNMMKDSDVKPNGFTYDILIEVQGRLGHNRDADEIFQTYFAPKPQKKASFISSLFHSIQKSTIKYLSFTSLASPLASIFPPPNTADSKVIPAQFKPTVNTFVALINAHGRNRNLPGLSYIYNTMLPTYNIKPDIKIYNALIEWYCRSENVELARKMFVDMGKYDIRPNVATFQHFFLLEANKRRRPKAAEDLMNFMKTQYGIQPLFSMYRTLIGVHNKSKREEEAKRLYREYMSLKTKPIAGSTK